MVTKAVNALDERGTTQEEGREMLRQFCENGFDGSAAAAALVLGRPPAEIESILDGDDLMDDSLMMKLRGVASERGIEIE